jgi:Bacterial regulatory helix-turn-helix protein, lysR family
MEQTQAEAVQRPSATEVGPPLGIELRHLRYFVALADAGSFTHAAERIFIAQPTLSHQIRRLEEIIGTPLLQRRREGLRLTAAGSCPGSACTPLACGRPTRPVAGGRRPARGR